jgi:hypothetical protein
MSLKVDVLIREALMYSSPRRTPGSSLLIQLDSGIRLNDGKGFIQLFFRPARRLARRQPIYPRGGLNAATSSFL